jgi:hypothetical protein
MGRWTDWLICSRTATRKVTLQRDDIVGRRIAGIYQSEWEADDDGFGGCRTYIALSDGTTFELQCQDLGIVYLVIQIDLAVVAAVRCSETDLARCIGQTVTEVLTSDYWPSMGLLTSGDRIIYTRDFPNMNRSGALLIGPYSDKVGERYGMHQVAPYWEKRGPAE